MVPITSDLDGYARFWDRWLKVLVMLVSLWGAVLEGTLLSIRVAVQPVAAPTPTPTLYVESGSFVSTAIDARSLGREASLMPVRPPGSRPREQSMWSVRNK